jgi:hypothetical protein
MQQRRMENNPASGCNHPWRRDVRCAVGPNPTRLHNAQAFRGPSTVRHRGKQMSRGAALMRPLIAGGAMWHVQLCKTLLYAQPHMAHRTRKGEE